MLTRRDFIKFLAVVGSGVLLPPLNRLRWLDLFNKHVSYGLPETLLPQTSSLGEIYAGFLLLPDGAPVPPNVKYPKRGMPTFCGVEAGRDGPVPTAVSQSFSTAAEMARDYVPSFSWYQWLYAGSTWICRWYWNEGWC